MKFCKHCANKMDFVIPSDDNLHRDVCHSCGYIDYENPKNIVGVLASINGEILLCKRNIEPRKNYWTVPAGFMENNESLVEGAKREAYEEVGIKDYDPSLFMIYSVPHISQVHIYFYTKLKNKITQMGPEINDIDFFSYKNIPWDEIAFKSISVLIKKFFDIGEENAKDKIFNLTFPDER